MSDKTDVSLCLFEGLADVIGEPASIGLLNYARIGFQDMVEDPARLKETLRSVFGEGAGQLERVMVHTLIRRLNMAPNKPEPSLDEAVRIALKQEK